MLNYVYSYSFFVHFFRIEFLYSVVIHILHWNVYIECILNLYCCFSTLNSSTQDNMISFIVVTSLVVALIGNCIPLVSCDKTITLDSFSIGDCIEVHYTAPTERATINLKQADGGNYVLHCDYRVDYNDMKDTLLLNAKFGSFDPSERQLVNDIKSTPGTIVEISICAADANTFSVTFNGKLLANYSNDDKTNISTLSQVQFIDDDGGDAELKSMCVKYASPSSDS